MQRRARQVSGAKPQALGCLEISEGLDESALAEQVPVQSSMANMFGGGSHAKEGGTDPNCRVSMLAAASCAVCTLAYCVKGTAAPAESPVDAAAMSAEHHGVFADLTSPVNQHPPKTASMVQRKISGRTKIAVKKSRKKAQEKNKQVIEQLSKKWRDDIEAKLDSWGVDKNPTSKNEDLVPPGPTSSCAPNASTHTAFGPAHTVLGHRTAVVAHSKHGYLHKHEGKMACTAHRKDIFPQALWDWRGKDAALKQQFKHDKTKQNSTRTSFVDILGARKSGRTSREVVCLHFGAAGANIGSHTWELFCLEHGIQPDGTMPSDKTLGGEDNAFNTFFSETGSGKHVPRCVMVDLEPTYLDEIRNGSYRRLFPHWQMLSRKEDSGGTFAGGHYGNGKAMIEEVMDAVRKVANDCNSLQGFMIYHATGGGTGSGLGCLAAERLAVDYGKKSKLGFAVLDANSGGASISLHNAQHAYAWGPVCDPYNTVCALHSLIEHTDVTVLYGNASLSDICRRNLDIERPTYKTLNRLLAQSISSLTASMRFDEPSLNVDINEMQRNLVPYPRMHFMISSYAPIFSAENRKAKQPTVTEITMGAFDVNSMFMKVDPGRHKYMACCLMYRGDVVPRDVNAAAATMKTKRTMSFVDWARPTFKCGITRQPVFRFKTEVDLAKVSRACYMISNNTAMGGASGRIGHLFDKLYSSRAFVHHFVGEGMDESHLLDAREDLSALEKDYAEVEKDNGGGGDDEEE